MFQAMRAVLRRFLTWILAGIVGTIVLAVVAEWFIEVARDKGLFTDAGGMWDSVVGTVLTAVLHPWFLAALTGLGGLVAGLWIDAFLRRIERRRVPDYPALAEALIRIVTKYRTLRNALDRDGIAGGLTTIEDAADEWSAVHVSLLKAGIQAPNIFFEADPIGFLERIGGYGAKVAPLLAAGHIAEAHSIAQMMADKITAESPKPKWLLDIEARKQH